MIKKIKTTISSQLTQGATPEKLAQSLACGVLAGCFPILGATTALSALLGAFFKLNHITVQAANYAMYPVQLILIPIYLKASTSIVGIDGLSIRPDIMLKSFAKDWLGFLGDYGAIIVCALGIWLIGSLMFYTLLKLSLFSFIEKIYLK